MIIKSKYITNQKLITKEKEQTRIYYVRMTSLRENVRVRF